MDRHNIIDTYGKGERNFEGCDFHGQSMRHWNVAGCNFSCSNFSGTDMSYANFSDCNLEDCNFDESTVMWGTNFDGAIFDTGNRHIIGAILLNASETMQQRMLAVYVRKMEGKCWSDFSYELLNSGQRELRHWAAKVLWEYECLRNPIRNHGRELIVQNCDEHIGEMLPKEEDHIDDDEWDNVPF